MFFLPKPATAVRVDLGHDQRHVRIHPPGRRIVDHDGTGGADLRRPFLRHRAARRHQADVDVGEIVMLERFDFQGPVAVGDFNTHAAARRQRHDLVGGEFALVQNVEHFPPDIAGRADHCDFVTHRSLSDEKCPPPAARGKGRASASMRETPSTQRYHGAQTFNVDRFGPTRPISPDANQNPPGADELCRRSLRHGGTPVCLCGDAGAACHPWPSTPGINCRPSKPTLRLTRPAGAWPTAPTRRSPSVNSIHPKNQ